MHCLLSYLQYIPRITHDTVILSVQIDPADESTYLAAKIFCCFCKESFAVRQYSRAKKDGSKGSERWITSNFDTHMRSKHSHIANSRSVSEPNILKFFEKNDKSLIESQSSEAQSEDDVIFLSSDNASGEELPRSRQERVLLDQKSSSEIQEADATKTKEIDTDQ